MKNEKRMFIFGYLELGTFHRRTLVLRVRRNFSFFSFFGRSAGRLGGNILVDQLESIILYLLLCPPSFCTINKK